MSSACVFNISGTFKVIALGTWSQIPDFSSDLVVTPSEVLTSAQKVCNIGKT